MSMTSYLPADLSTLQNEKGLTQAQRVRLAAVNSALALVMQAVGTEGSGHLLAEEMQRFSDYVAAIEAALPFGKNP